MDNNIMEGMYGGSTSQIGQGLAYVLPETRSDKYFVQRALDDRDKLYQKMVLAEKAKQERSELIDRTLRDKYLAPDSWQPFNKLIGDQWGQWNREAVGLKTKGVDPTTDSKSLEDFNKIKGLANYSNMLKDQLITIQKAILTKGGDYSDADIKRFENEYEDMTSNPKAWYDSNKTFSSLSPKEATFEDFTKGMKAAEKVSNDGTFETKGADIDANRRQVVAKLMADPEKYSNAAMKQFGVNLGELPFVINDGIPVDDQSIKGITERMMNSPKRNEYLEKNGIDPKDEFAGEKLADRVKEINSGWSRMTDNLSAGLNSSVANSSKRVFDKEKLLNENRRISIAQQNANTNAKSLDHRIANDSKESKSYNERRKFINGVQSFNKEALDRLDVALGEIHVNGVHAKRIMKGDTMLIRVPIEVQSKTITNKKEVKYQDYSFPKGSNTEKGKDMINSILNRSKSFGEEKQLKVTPYDDTYSEDVFQEGELDNI